MIILIEIVLIIVVVTALLIAVLAYEGIILEYIASLYKTKPHLARMFSLICFILAFLLVKSFINP
jgi:hypothetical protein